jgi:hypothetical protein
VGTRVKIAGSHLCQSGTCPVSPNRSNSADNVKFGSTQASDNDFVSSGAAPCSGNAQAWTDSEICVNVPTGTPGGSQPTKVTNYTTFTSNTKSWGGYKAEGYIISSTFDTAVSTGAAPNTIMWQGDALPSTAHVKFQFASSSSVNGPWDYIGTDGTSGTYYDTTGPNSPLKINLAHHNNKRYMRYKMILNPSSDTSQSPRVTDVIFNWSP